MTLLVSVVFNFMSSEFCFLFLSQISQWMTGKSFLDISSSDVAVQLDLISKVHGVERAEEYFNNIPETSKNFQVYGALLNCYAGAKLLEKAEAVMQKIRDLGYARTLSYNVIMNLYSNFREHDKLDSLMQEMEEKLIRCDKFTYGIRLNAYGVALDIDGMEKLLMKMEADPFITIDWNAYVVVAKGYIRAGNMEKALAMLRKSEQLIRVNTRKLAYEILMSLYAGMGNKDEMFRIWNLYKKNEKFSNMTYLCAISSLAKLDDLDAAEKILEEWEAKRISFDFRVPNLLISSYCRKGLLGKAESIVHRLVESGNEPNASTWSRMALGYHKGNQMERAVESLNKSIQVGEPGWKPPRYTLIACLEYLKQKGDLDTIERIKTSLAKKGLDYTDVYESLAGDSKGEIAEENPDFKAFDRTESVE